MRSARLLALALLCCVGCEAIVGPKPPATRAALYDELWGEFDLHYSFFNLKQINWDSLGALYRPSALAATTDTAFAGVLGQLLTELHDVHVVLYAGNQTIRSGASIDTFTTRYDPTTIFDYAIWLRASPSQHFTYALLAPGIGYIRIPNFTGAGWSGEIDSVLTDLNANAVTRIIVDIRDNGGGDNTLSRDITGRFATQAATYAYVRFRNGPSHSDFTDYVAADISPTGTRHFGGPVYLLTNRRCFSTAEDFVLSMKSVPTVTTVGDTTGGGSGSPILRELQNGWTYQLPEWIEYTPSKQTFERIGLAPDVTVKISASNAMRGIDSQLERAIVLAETR